MSILEHTRLTDPRPLSSRLLSILLGSALGLGMLLSPAYAQNPESTLVASPSSVWELAEDGSDTLLAPRYWESTPVDPSLIDSMALLQTNIAKREVQRAETIEESNEQLAEHLAKYEEGGSPVALADALRSAVSLQLLYTNEDDFFSNTQAKRVIDLAIDYAQNAEARGDWLMASELYFRLDTLHDTSRIFKDDVDRLTRRLSMIRLYAPQRLWELRNERRILDGEEPLPPYNPYGDLYTDKLAGIESVAVRTAIQRAAAQHVARRSGLKPDGVELDALIQGGLDAIRTMATTTDLEAAFEGLGNTKKRQRFIDAIDELKERFGPGSRSASAYDLRRAIDGVLSASRDTVEIMPEAILHEFGNGAMAQLDDYTAIIWPDEVARFQRSTQGEFIGIGVRIQHDELMNVEVVTPLEGTPAQRAGLRAGDVIKKVDGISAIGLGLDQAVEVITGPPNTDVNITIEREDDEGNKSEHTYTITRAKIDLPSVKGWSKTGPRDDDWNYFIDPDEGVGYVRLTGFTETTTREFDAAVRDMKSKGLSSLILDLRYNPGGLLDQAVKMASRFVPDGLIVKTVDASGAIQDAQDARAVNPEVSLRDIPVVVLINEGSASASEILSGSIQAAAHRDKIQALVIGSRSFGKGSVQNVFVLPGGTSAMKLTTQYYQIDAPRLIHKLPGASEWGIEPDLRVEMLPEQNAQALLLRRDADVYLSGEDNSTRPDPESLITEGTDLQVQTALVLLRTQSKKDSRAVLNE